MVAQEYIDAVLHDIQVCSPGQVEFYQASEEVLHTLLPLLEEEPKYIEHNILRRIVIPERTIIFRVV